LRWEDDLQYNDDIETTMIELNIRINHIKNRINNTDKFELIGNREEVEYFYIFLTDKINRFYVSFSPFYELYTYAIK